MSRQNIAELLRNGPSISFVADTLGVSRPTFYRQMEYYKNSQDEKMNVHVKEYFDYVVVGKFATKEEAVKYLEQSKYLIEGEKESHREAVMKAQSKLFQEMHELDFARGSLSASERISREDAIDKRRKEIEELAESFDIELEGDWFYRESERLEWNQGEIRSTCKNFIEKVYVLVDVPYAQLRNVEVELYAVVSGEDFSIRRVRMPADSRCVDMGDVPDGIVCKYSLRWTDEDKVKTAGPYLIGKTGY